LVSPGPDHPGMPARPPGRLLPRRPGGWRPPKSSHLMSDALDQRYDELRIKSRALAGFHSDVPTEDRVGRWNVWTHTLRFIERFWEIERRFLEARGARSPHEQARLGHEAEADLATLNDKESILSAPPAWAYPCRSRRGGALRIDSRWTEPRTRPLWG